MNLADFFNNELVRIIGIIIIALVLSKLSGKIIERVVRRIVRPHHFETKVDEKKREDTIKSIFHAAIGFIIWVVAVAAILSTLSVNLASVATGAGFFGVIIGLGAQSTVRDYLAGVFILIENQYRVGDIVTLRGGTTGIGTSGVVEEISLRITKLRDLDGTLSIVRNGEASIITNRTFKYSSIVIDVRVAYDSNIDLIEQVINETGVALKLDPLFADDINESLRFLRVDDFTESAVLVRIIGQVKPARQWDVGGEYRRRLLKAFAKHHIKFAVIQLAVDTKN